jgi:hypothetical protein
MIKPQKYQPNEAFFVQGGRRVELPGPQANPSGGAN